LWGIALIGQKVDRSSAGWLQIVDALTIPKDPSVQQLLCPFLFGFDLFLSIPS
jgi:hypothetical protein